MVSIVANDGYTIQNMAADNNKLFFITVTILCAGIIYQPYNISGCISFKSVSLSSTFCSGIGKVVINSSTVG